MKSSDSWSVNYNTHFEDWQVKEKSTYVKEACIGTSVDFVRERFFKQNISIHSDWTTAFFVEFGGDLYKNPMNYILVSMKAHTYL